MADEDDVGRTAAHATVRARRPDPEPLRWLNYRERVATSLWFVPAAFIVAALLLSRITIAIDTALGAGAVPDSILRADAGGAAVLAATVAGGALTLVAIVFSTTLVAIQLAASQYSPRIVRVFVRLRLTHLTLATFLATFVFSLDALVEIRSGPDDLVPRVTILCVYLFVLATLVMFISFVHGIVRLLRVQYVLTVIERQTEGVLHHHFPGPEAYQQVARPFAGPDDRVTVVRNTTTRVGALQAMDLAVLVALAADRDVHIEFIVQVGEYLAAGTPLAHVHGAPSAGAVVTAAELLGGCYLGGERTMIQDPGFGFRQLVDTASRALSPAVNDPTTAVNAIDRIVNLLSLIADRPDPTGWYLDAAGQPRLHRPEPDFERLAVLGFSEIQRYGADAPQVARRLYGAYRTLGEQLDGDRAAAISHLRSQLDEAVATAMPPAFLTLARTPDRFGLG